MVAVNSEREILKSNGISVSALWVSTMWSRDLLARRCAYPITIGIRLMIELNVIQCWARLVLGWVTTWLCKLLRAASVGGSYWRVLLLVLRGWYCVVPTVIPAEEKSNMSWERKNVMGGLNALVDNLAALQSSSLQRGCSRVNLYASGSDMQWLTELGTKVQAWYITYTIEFYHWCLSRSFNVRFNVLSTGKCSYIIQ